MEATEQTKLKSTNADEVSCSMQDAEPARLSASSGPAAVLEVPFFTEGAKG